MWISLWLGPPQLFVCLVTEGTGEGSEGRVYRHKVSSLLTHPQRTPTWRCGPHWATLCSCLKDLQLIFTADTEGGAQTSSGEHFSEHRLLLLNKVSRGILKCKRGVPSVTQAQAAENTKPSPPSPPTNPQVLRRPRCRWKPQVGGYCAMLLPSYHGHLWHCYNSTFISLVSGVCCPPCRNPDCLATLVGERELAYSVAGPPLL